MTLKQIRGQLRQITKELLPELLTVELKSSMYDTMLKTIESRLKGIENEVRSVMEEINTRSKDAQDFMVRNVSAMIPTSLSTSDTPSSTKVEE